MVAYTDRSWKAKRKTAKPHPLPDTPMLFIDTLTHTPHPLPGLPAFDLLAIGLVDVRWL